MEPMNAFLSSSRESFKAFIDDVCSVPVPVSSPTQANAPKSSPTYPPGVVSAEMNRSYTTPMTIMQRLPPTSREGFPSLPYLIDQARAFAELVQLWLDATTDAASATASSTSAKSHAELIAALQASEGELMAFHQICSDLSRRTQECLSRAERAERPNSALSFRWDELIDQLQPSSHPDSGDEMLQQPQPSSMDTLAERVAKDVSVASPTARPSALTREWDVMHEDDDDDDEDIEEEGDPHLSSTMATRLYNTTPSTSASQTTFAPTPPARDRPGSAGVVSSLRESLRRAAIPSSRASESASLPPSTSASNVSSDTEHSSSGAGGGSGTTALPSYARERRHREIRDAAKRQIQAEVEAARAKESSQKERRRVRTPIVSALRKKKEREKERVGSAGASSSSAAPVEDGG